MLEIVENRIDEFGDKRIRLLSSRGVAIRLRRYVPVYLLRHAAGRVEAVQCVDDALGIVTTDICYPMLGPVDFQLAHPRRLMVVHRCYGGRMSECVRLGVEGWAAGTKQAAELAFVRSLPAGVEDGVEVFGCHLFAAEWMIPGCVGVGV